MDRTYTIPMSDEQADDIVDSLNATIEEYMDRIDNPRMFKEPDQDEDEFIKVLVKAIENLRYLSVQIRRQRGTWQGL